MRASNGHVFIEFAVHYDFEWCAVGEEQPVTLGNFIVRYWPEDD